MIKVLPSSNPEKEEKLVSYARKLSDLGVEYLHCDVMDGVFVDNKCLSIEKIRDVRNNVNILLDVHLMVSNPKKVIKNYIELKPSIITVHYEAVKNHKTLKKLSKLVRAKDILFGVSIKPETSVSVLGNLIKYIDLILIMTVEPGKSGQTLMLDCLDKVKDAKCLVGNRDVIIEVDGGVNLDNYKKIVSSGANFLVMGNAFYKSKEKEKLLYTIDKHYPKFQDKKTVLNK